MRERSPFRTLLFAAAAVALFACAGEAPGTGEDVRDPAAAPPAQGDTPYRFGPASRDGIGKFYRGREISHVMGHRGAGWLERPSREAEERTDLVVDKMALAPDAVVADIGAGTGYFAFRLAEAVPAGRVVAVDIQPEMLAMIEARAAEGGIRNVVSHRGTIEGPGLAPASLDAALIVDAYHEFSHPVEMLAGIRAALKPGGRLYLLEYRAEDPRVAIKPLHKMSERQAIEEVEAAGLRWVETGDFLPQQHFLVFEKVAPATVEAPP